MTNTPDVDEYSDTTTIFKGFSNTKSIQYLRTLMNDVTWEEVENTNCPDKAYNLFLKIFQSIYDQAFPLTKTLLRPWITKRLIKSSKTKHTETKLITKSTKICLNLLNINPRRHIIQN